MQVTRVSTLPRLAWGVHAPASGDEPRAVVGEWVEASSTHVLEGAWNGNFSDVVGIADSFSFMGSGVLQTAAGLTVVAPCNTLEGVYSVTSNGGFYVSNSIALLLELAGRDLDPTYEHYEADALTISDGLGRNTAAIPLAGGGHARVHLYCNVDWSPGEGVREAAKPLPPTPTDYDDYRNFLSREVKGVVANATDPARRVTFPPIAFCSTGYDSTACAALGKEVGCDEAVVYESKRGSRTDAGTEIVNALGYSTVHEKREIEYMETDLAHLFLGNGELGTSLFFASASKELEGKTLLSGAHGDLMWGRDHVETDARLVRSEYPDTAKKEFRLQVGFIKFPPAFLTAMIQPEIHRLSNAEELKPWRLDNDYDRPIPRRIAEDAGVPREAFGIEKGGGAGSSMRFGNLAYLARTMPPKSFAQFAPYWRRLKRQRRKNLDWLVRSAAYLVYAATTWLSLRGHSWPRRLLRVEAWGRRYTCSPFAPSGLFVWAVDLLRSTSYRGVAEVAGSRVR